MAAIISVFPGAERGKALGWHLSVVGSGAIAGPAFVGVFGTEKEVYFTVAISLGVLIFSEIIPKTAGVVYARSLARVIARPIQWLVWIFTPFIWLNQFITRLITQGAPEVHSAPFCSCPETICEGHRARVPRIASQSGPEEPAGSEKTNARG